MSRTQPASGSWTLAATLSAILSALLLALAAPGARAQSQGRVYLPAMLKRSAFQTPLPAPTASAQPTSPGGSTPPIEPTPTRPGGGTVAPTPAGSGWRHVTDPNIGLDLAVDPLTGDPWTVAGYGGAVRWSPDQGRGARLGTADGVASWRLLSVAVDRQGQVWLGGEDGRVSQRLAAGGWRIHGPGDGAGGAGSGLRAEPVLSLSLDGADALWVLQPSQILRRSAAGAWEGVALPAGVQGPADLAAGPGGALWLGARDQVFERAAGGTWTAHPIANGLGIPDHSRKIAVGADGAVAVATFAALHLRPAGPGAAWRTFGVAGGEIAELPLSVAFDGQGRLIVGTDTAVLRLEPDDSWSRPLGSAEVFALDVGVAPSGRIYAAGDDGLRWSTPAPAAAGHLRLAGLRGNRITRIALEAGGAAWLLADQVGLSRMDPAGSFSHEDEATGLGSRRLWDLTLAGGDVWAATDDIGLRRRGPLGSWSGLARPDGLASDTVTSVHLDALGQLWAGHLDGPPVGGRPPGGVSLRGLGGVWTQFTTASGLASNDVRAIRSDPAQNVWVASFDHGLAHRDPQGAWTVHNAANSGLITDTVRALAVAPDGTVYAGTPAGLAIRAPVGAWRTLGQAEGLPGERVSAVALENDGRVWVGTEEGAAVLAPDGTVTAYPSAEGGLLPGPVLAIAVAANGDVWFSSDLAGISVLGGASRTDR